jgi:hypothetical protein
MFLQQVKAADNGRQKEIRIDINQAKNLAHTLGLVMTRMNGNLEEIFAKQTNNSEDQVISVQVDGGNTW